MTDRRIRDLRRLLETEAAVFGAIVAIETCGSGHLRCTFTVGVRAAFITASRSPSDPHTSRHVRADARRTLRHLVEAQHG
jgi:hypothetical protein